MSAWYRAQKHFRNRTASPPPPPAPADAPSSSPSPSPEVDDNLDGEAAIFKVSTKRYLTLGFATSFVLVVVFGGWAALAHISGAVIAQGTVVVGSRVKDVQHLDGGIVSAIYVKNGDHVAEGELLVELDDTQTRAGRDIVAAQLVSLTARLDRLIAERDRTRAVAFRASVRERADEADVAELINAQKAVFTARRATLDGQVAQLNEQLAQLTERIHGLEAQRTAKRDEIVLIADELADLEALLKDDLVPRSRVTERKRQNVRLAGEEGELTANIAAARGRMAEVRRQIVQIETEFQSDVLDEIADVQTQIAELAERDIAATDSLERVDLVAPVAGIVHELAVGTIGGVVAPGATLMRIVPESDDLEIDARVRPTDVDDVAPGQPAEVLFSGLPIRSTPRLEGVVSTVSADASIDEQSGLAYFTTRVTLPESELAALGDVVLIPGMPAEVFIKTKSRSVLNYLMQPLFDAANLTFAEP